MGVEDEGGVEFFIAIGIVGFAAVAFKSLGQIAEGALDIGDGVADMQTLRRLDVVGDGRWRMLSFQRISLGEKLGGGRALDR